MIKSKIYDVKKKASEKFVKLRSNDGKYFYRNDRRFPNDEVGDHVFVVNQYTQKALYTVIEIKNIFSPASDRITSTSQALLANDNAK